MYNFTHGFTAKEASMLTLTADSFMNFRERVYAGIKYEAAKDHFSHVESFDYDRLIGLCIEMKLFMQELRDKGFRVNLDKENHCLRVSWNTPQNYVV